VLLRPMAWMLCLHLAWPGRRLDFLVLSNVRRRRRVDADINVVIWACTFILSGLPALKIVVRPSTSR